MTPEEKERLLALRDQLRSVMSEYDIPDTWREPDEKDIGAVVTGQYLDNAFGVEGSPTVPYMQEYIVHLWWKDLYREILAVNLADLLALAVMPYNLADLLALAAMPCEGIQVIERPTEFGPAGPQFAPGDNLEFVDSTSHQETVETEPTEESEPEPAKPETESATPSPAKSETESATPAKDNRSGGKKEKQEHQDEGGKETSDNRSGGKKEKQEHQDRGKRN